jgi:hypothetical protein
MGWQINASCHTGFISLMALFSYFFFGLLGFRKGLPKPAILQN